MPRKGKHDWHALAEADPDVMRWFRKRSARSEESGDVNLRNLMRCLDEFRQLRPKDLLGMKQKELDDFMEDFVAFFLKKGRFGSTVSKYADSVISWLDYNGRHLERKLVIPGADENPNAEAQEMPSPEKVAELLLACDLRTSVIVAMEVFAGVRPQVLGKNRKDGLMLGDFPELSLAGSPTFTKVPAQVRVRKSISKIHRDYITFIGPQGCEILTAYLRSRSTAGEELHAKSPLLIPASGPPRFCHRNNVQDCLRSRMQKVDVKATTYITRSYFASCMTTAALHGVPETFSRYWMGHTGSMMSKYAFHRQLAPGVIEEMRQAFAKALPYLETRSGETEDPRRIAYEGLLQVVGYSQEDVTKANVESKTPAEILAMARDAFTRVRQNVPIKVSSAQPKQKLVDEEDVPAALDQGWNFKEQLRSGKILLEFKGE